jgi:N-sulfoglucosamine sulfohydrolase
MKNLSFCWTLLILFSIPSLGRVSADEAGAAARPNILWITAEDLSPDLGCYGNAYAATPHLDQLAQEGVRYTHAFASAPVCSPARSCLITGVYATSLGTQNLRSDFPIPDSIVGFPKFLREQGYYCSNNVKTDYNTADAKRLTQESWDESSATAHWRNRAEGQAFFSVFNLMETHQSRTCVWSFEEFEEKIGSQLTSENRHDPDKAPLPPYYPDIPIVRRTLARYYDCISVMDLKVGQLLKQLEDDGLADSTIVFFYGDHGAGLPRGKRVLFDSGLRVPLLIRVPPRFRELVPATPGSTDSQLVSFVDFAPTILNLASIETPGYMQGRPFLGPEVKRRREVIFGARDRVDEAYDLSRCVRDDRFLYIRNFLPHISLNQPERYSDSAAMRREITRMAAAGQLDAAQMTYAGPRKPIEGLYDTEQDPFQLNNLAGRPEYRDQLERMRRACRRWILETHDLGFLPESLMAKDSRGTTPWEMRQDSSHYPLERILDAADMVGRYGEYAQQIPLLQDPHAAVRFWAVVGLRTNRQKATELMKWIDEMMRDPVAVVRIQAAAAMLEKNHAPALEIMTKELKSDDLNVVLMAARELQRVGELARPAIPAMREALAQATAREGQDPLQMFIRFSLEAALEELEREQ